MIKAIQTIFKGYKMRSRLEARYGVFFDSLGIKWEYEPEWFELGGGVRYLPDFFLPEFGLYVEVKPLLKSTHKCEKFRDVTGFPIILCSGVPGENLIQIYCHDTTSSTSGTYDGVGVFSTGYSCNEVNDDNFRKDFWNNVNVTQKKVVVQGVEHYINDVKFPHNPCKFVVIDNFPSRELHDGDYIPLSSRIVLIKDMFSYVDTGNDIDETLKIYNSGIKSACNSAKSARFEFGESGV